MKDELGSNDAVDVEAVGAAYVENFALKVFANADGEDRKGLASRYAMCFLYESERCLICILTFQERPQRSF